MAQSLTALQRIHPCNQSPISPGATVGQSLSFEHGEQEPI